MLLSDGSIAKLLEAGGPGDDYKGGLGISNLGNDAIQPCSIDIRLGKLMARQVKCDRPVTVDSPPVFVPKDLSIPDYTYILQPGEFYLATTVEYFFVGDDIALKLEGKSSLGRLGLEVHSTAGWVDPGFMGELTLEMKVVGIDPVQVWINQKIAQVCVFQLDQPCERPYGHVSRNSKYQHQTGPTGARRNNV